MVALHIEAPPRVPGDSLRGKQPHDYGRGRVCSLPGCTTVLRRTHKGPVCDPCQDNHRCGSPASACSEAAPTAAPAVRRAKEEKVAKESMREAVLMVFARDPSRCFNADDVMKSSGVSPSCVYKNLKALVASGEIVKDGPGVYRWPKIEDAKTAPDPLPAPAPAPMTGVPLGTEQPADVAPAPALETPLEPVPAAGEYTAATPKQIVEAMMKPRAFANLTQFEVHGRSRPVRVICELDEMDPAEREAVLQLAVSLWWLK